MHMRMLTVNPPIVALGRSTGFIVQPSGASPLSSPWGARPRVGVQVIVALGRSTTYTRTAYTRHACMHYGKLRMPGSIMSKSALTHTVALQGLALQGGGVHCKG